MQHGSTCNVCVIVCKCVCVGGGCLRALLARGWGGSSSAESIGGLGSGAFRQAGGGSWAQVHSPNVRACVCMCLGGRGKGGRGVRKNGRVFQEPGGVGYVGASALRGAGGVEEGLTGERSLQLERRVRLGQSRAIQEAGGSAVSISRETPPCRLAVHSAQPGQRWGGVAAATSVHK